MGQPALSCPVPHPTHCPPALRAADRALEAWGWTLRSCTGRQMTGTGWWLESAGTDTSQGTSLLDLVVGLSHLGFAAGLAVAGAPPGRSCGTVHPSSPLRQSALSKEEMGHRKRPLQSVPKLCLATSLLWELDTIWEWISVLATPALPSFLPQPPATSPPLPPAPGEPPGLVVMYRQDKAVCWLARVAGLQPGHTLALLTTQSHACLQVAFPGTDPLCHDNNLIVNTGIS